ncbi:hypothetical protein V8E51_008627 [Hyaloscypha variabilis]
MSFGWSAGDIAAAITLIIRLIDTLDSNDGAASDYREAVAFLGDLKRTLDPLRTFSAWITYPVYGRDIEDQAKQIRDPVKAFVAAVQKYERSLGAQASHGHLRNMGRKVQWSVFMSKKVISLKRKIESHMRIIDSLMQRLTLEVVFTMQQQFPDDLRAAFQEVVPPVLVTTLRENLPPLDSKLLEQYHQIQERNHSALLSRLSEHYEGMSLDIMALKLQLKNSISTQEKIQCCIQGGNVRVEHDARKNLPRNVDPSLSTHLENDANSSQVVPTGAHWESLRDVYYLVFLYLGNFLKNLFLILARLVEPTYALTSKLLAKENILFLDALGRQRILPYEYFRSFKVLRAFIKYEFQTLPGAAWVNRGRYVISSLVDNQVLDQQSWTTMKPGAQVAMAMLVRKLLDSTSNPMMVQCPSKSCSGSWPRGTTGLWETCTICHKEILNADLKDQNKPPSELTPRSDVVGNGQHITDPGPIREEPVPKFRKDTNLFHGPLSLETNATEDQLDANEDDIAVFKRVVQQIILMQNSLPNSILGQTSGSSIETQTRNRSSSPPSADEDSEDYHPLVAKYLSGIEDLQHLQERVISLEVENLSKEKEIMSRSHLSLPLTTEDQTRLHHYQPVWENLLQKIGYLVKVIGQAGYSQGLTDKDGIISNFVKYPFLLESPQPGSKPKDLGGLDMSDQEEEEWVVVDTDDLINNWLLQELRSSTLHVSLLARTHEQMSVDTDAEGHWRIKVLS